MDLNNHTLVMLEPGGWGGICHYAYNLCQALQKKGTDVVLLTTTSYELDGLPREFRLEACLAPGMPYLQNLRKISETIRACRPCLLHVQSTLSARRDWLPLLCARLFGPPCVLTVHNVFPHDRAEREAAGMRPALELVYRSARALIVHGQAVRQELLTAFPLDPERAFDIPHGDYQFVRGARTVSKSEARARLGLPEDAPVALCFGAIREYKGIHLLIPAFARMRRHVPHARLVVVGKPLGVDPATYRQMIRSHGLEEAVIFRPEYIPLEDIGLYFAATDLVVDFRSSHEFMQPAGFAAFVLPIPAL